MIKTALVLLLICSFSLPAFAGINDKNFGSTFVDEVTSVYDGDTFRCTISGWPEIIGERMGIRIAGIDTPEMRDKRPAIKALAKKAKQYVVQRLRSAKTIELRNMHRGKYFRIVAAVYVDGSDLGVELLQKGLAQEYDGGKKTEW